MESTKKRASLRLPAKAGIWNIISGLVTRGIGACGTPIFTRLLTPAEYGLYPLYTTWMAVVAALVASGLTGSAIYRGLQRYSGRREEFIAAATGLGLLTSLLLLTLGAPLSAFISELTGLERPILLILVLEVAFSTVIALRSSWLRFEYRYKELALTGLISALGTPTISVILVKLTPYRAEARIIGSLLATVIVALPMLLHISRHSRLYDKEIWRYLVRVSLPLVPHYLSSSLILRASEMVIGRSHGGGALAKYSVGISVGLALTFLSNALSGAISPWILRKIAEGREDIVRTLVGLALGGLSSASLLLLCFAPEVLAVLTPAEYADALPTVYPLALSVSAMFLVSALTSAEAYYERSLRSSLPTVVTAAASLGLAVIILPRADYRISALFTLGAYLLLVLLSVLNLKKISGKSIIDSRKCALIFAFCTLYALILFAFRGVLISRVLLAIPIVPFSLSLAGRIFAEIREV